MNRVFRRFKISSVRTHREMSQSSLLFLLLLCTLPMFYPETYARIAPDVHNGSRIRAYHAYAVRRDSEDMSPSDLARQLRVLDENINDNCQLRVGSNTVDGAWSLICLSFIGLSLFSPIRLLQRMVCEQPLHGHGCLMIRTQCIVRPRFDPPNDLDIRVGQVYRKHVSESGLSQ